MVNGTKRVMTEPERIAEPLCGCGRVDKREFLRDVLAACSGDAGAWDTLAMLIDARNDRKGELILDLLDALGLTEHGATLYFPWLTDEGEALLDSLRKRNRLIEEPETSTDGSPCRIYQSEVEILANEIARLKSAEARVRAEIAAQPYRHQDAPCTDECVRHVCKDVLAALDHPTGSK